MVPGPDEAFLGLVCISVLLGNQCLNDLLLSTDLKVFPYETLVFLLCVYTRTCTGFPYVACTAVRKP